MVALAVVYRALANTESAIVTPAALDEAIVGAEAAYVAQFERVTLADLIGRTGA